MWVEACLDDASLVGTHLYQSLWVDTQAARVQLQNAQMGQAICHRAHLPGAQFEGADLTYTDFSHADLTQARFGRNTWLRTKFHRTKRDGVSIPPGSDVLWDDPELAAAEQRVPQPLAS